MFPTENMFARPRLKVTSVCGVISVSKRQFEYFYLYQNVNGLYFFSRACFRTNQKVFCNLQNHLPTVVPVGISCLTSWDYSSQDPTVGTDIDTSASFPSLHSSFDTINTTIRESEMFQVLSIFFLVF